MDLCSLSWAGGQYTTGWCKYLQLDSNRFLLHARQQRFSVPFFLTMTDWCEISQLRIPEVFVGLTRGKKYIQQRRINAHQFSQLLKRWHEVTKPLHSAGRDSMRHKVKLRRTLSSLRRRFFLSSLHSALQLMAQLWLGRRSWKLLCFLEVPMLFVEL